MDNSPFFMIRRVEPDDLMDLRAISIRTFEETFGATNAEGDMAMYLLNSFSPEILEKELNTPGTEFYFALERNMIAGYLKVNSGDAQTEFRNTEGFEIERLYILKGFKGKGIGTLLFEMALALAGEYRATYLWLGVYEKNYPAIHFYEKLGLLPFDEHIFQLGTDPQRDILMKKAL